MKRLNTWAALLLWGAAFIFAGLPAHAADVTLPVEVLGPDGTTNSATFSLPGSVSAASVKTLSMLVHNLSYDGKMDVRINGGSWISIANANVTVPGIPGQVGGIGGSFDTITVNYAIPSSQITSGSNTITWRMNHTDGVSIGYRVVRFNLLDSGGSNLLPASTFANTNVNASSFTNNSGVSLAPNQVDKGRDAWAHYVLKINSNNLATNIKAHCADCHAGDGRDLKYFNFSNGSIIKRSEFHQVPHKVAVQIACYIRSLTTPNPGYPWSPLYQPGTGLDSGPVTSWAAGAGIDAVLSTDSAALPYLFPGSSITAANMATSGHLNPRETPVALQMPSWTSWLPRVHPLDAFGTSFSNSPFFTFYTTMENRIKAAGASSYTANAFGGNYQNRSQAGRDQTQWDAYQVSYLTARKGAAGASTSWTQAFTEDLYSAAQWHNVKQWELEQEYLLEEYGVHTYGTARGEKRMWYGQLHFYQAPGIIGIPANDTQAPRGQAGNGKKWWITANTFWYQLQVILNDGAGFRVSTGPLDFPYYVNSAALYERITGVQTAYLLMEYIILRNQLNHNSFGLNASTGWDPKLQESIEPQYDPGDFDVWFKQLDNTTKVQLFNAFTAVWLNENKLYTPAQFYASGITTAAEDWKTYPNLAQEAYQILYRGKLTIGTDHTLLTQVAAWAKTLWPSRDWDSLTAGLSGSTYYVATTGSDAGAGTLAAPFKTIAHGAALLHPGDTLYVRAGTYAENFNRTIPSGTDWTAPVTIAGYPGDAAPVIEPTASVASVFFFDNGAKYIQIQGVVIDGTHVTTDAVKITTGGSGAAGHIRLQSCEVRFGPQQNILVTHSAYNEFIDVISHDACTTHQGSLGRSLCHTLYVESDHNTVTRGEYYNSAGYGIQLYSSDGTSCHDNTVNGASVHNNALNGTTSGGGIVTGSGANNLVENCNVYSNPNNGILCDYAAVTNSILSNNIHDNSGVGFTIGTGSTGAIFSGNTFSGNGTNFVNNGN